MGIWDRLRAELIDIIEWLDPSSDTMVYRFERYGNEIKHGAKLIVREGQAAVFVNEGQIGDVFGPGTHTLETKNLPILATILGWKYGFESPFKSEVYFVTTRRFTDLKWGTQNPIMLRDEEFGPVRLRAFGSYEARVDEPGVFIRQIVGTDAHFTTDEITEQLRNLIVSRFADILGESKIPVLDLAANYDELGEFVTGRIHGDFGDYGIEVTKLLVENISLPPAVEEAMDKRSSMGVIGDLKKYTQYQAAEALGKAAENPSGMASGGMGMGMGFAMATQMSEAMNTGASTPASTPASAPPAGAAPSAAPSAAPGAAVPPPLPATVEFHVAEAGRPTGPFPIDVVRQRIIGGAISRETLVWKAGLAQWVPAAEAVELVDAFNRTPPPLPPNG